MEGSNSQSYPEVNQQDNEIPTLNTLTPHQSWVLGTAIWQVHKKNNQDQSSDLKVQGSNHLVHWKIS